MPQPISLTPVERSVAIGKTVHYVLPRQFATAGDHRAATITAIHAPGEGDGDEAPLCVALTVFLVPMADYLEAGGDGEDGDDDLLQFHFPHRVPYDAEGRPGTWHWSEV